MRPYCFTQVFCSLQMAQHKPKTDQNSTSTEPCFRWGWNFRPESRQQSPTWPNIAFYVEPMFGQKNGLFYALNQRPKEPHCFWVMSGPDMRELRHLCGHSQPDFGEWVGVEPSTSQKSSLIRCWEKIWGETSAEDCKKYFIFRDIDGSTDLF